MKKILLIFTLLGILTLSLFSCNQSVEEKNASIEKDSVEKALTGKDSMPLATKEEVDTLKFNNLDFKAFEQCALTGPGIGDIILNSLLSDAMVRHFDDVYGKYTPADRINAFKRGYWMDKCLVDSIDKFLKNNASNYDGIRLRFGCELSDDSTNYPHDHFKRKTSLFIYATKPNGTDNTTHEKKHRDDEEITIPVSLSCPTASEYIKPHSFVKPRTNAFDSIYRHRNVPPNQAADFDALSQGIWIAPCVFAYLNDLLQNSSYNLDGIKIKTAAYFELNSSRPSQKYPNQSTIVIVPTSTATDSNNHVERPDVIHNFIQVLELKKIKFDKSGNLNHGQLCPNQCN